MLFRRFDIEYQGTPIDADTSSLDHLRAAFGPSLVTSLYFIEHRHAFGRTEMYRHGARCLMRHRAEQRYKLARSKRRKLVASVARNN